MTEFEQCLSAAVHYGWRNETRAGHTTFLKGKRVVVIKANSAGKLTAANIGIRPVLRNRLRAVLAELRS